ncbi:hypothetical protein BZG73_03155, partial [Salinivibrio siamensis]
MSLKEDLKSVLAELSPILAGFKLAVIVIGYFGFGSVAKWIISYWYPFTRWVWNQVAIVLYLPEFPLIVKDSLTALVFFMPLGITAISQRIRGVEKSEEKHRVSSALFGFLFLILICKDVITSILDSLSTSIQEFNSSEEYQSFLRIFERFDEAISTAVPIYTGLVGVYLLIKILTSTSALKKISFSTKFTSWENKLKVRIGQQSRHFLRINLIVTLILFPLLGLSLVFISEPVNASAILGAIVILIIIFASLLLAIFYA